MVSFPHFQTIAAVVTSRKRRPRKIPPPSTFYYLESYFAACLLANRIVTRVPFAGLRWRIVPILGIANRRDNDSRYSGPRSPTSSLIILFVPRTRLRGKRENGLWKNRTAQDREQSKNGNDRTNYAPFVASRKLIPYGQPRKKTGSRREKTSRIQSTTSKLFRWLNFARRLGAPWPRPPRSRDNSALRLPCLRREERRIRVNVAG